VLDNKKDSTMTMLTTVLETCFMPAPLGIPV
jgi:hypothetical protein